MLEGDHSLKFRKRIQELTGEDPFPGGVPDRKEDEKRMAIVGNPNLTDIEKIEKLKSTRKPVNGKKDQLSDMFLEKDHDLESAIMLGRFVAEERQTETFIAEAYEMLKSRSSKL